MRMIYASIFVENKENRKRRVSGFSLSEI